jgi:hypothetical protein
MTTKIDGLSVVFTDASTTSPGATVKTVSWSFGDGANAVGATVTHPFLGSGTYLVLETVIDSNGLTAQASGEVSVQGYDPRAQLPVTVTDTRSALLTGASAAGLTLKAPVVVYCGRSAAAWSREVAKIGKTALGWAILGSHQAHVWPAGCALLSQLATPTGRAALLKTRLRDVARALLVVVHEIGHADGVDGERQADCYGLANMSRYAILGLGFTQRSSLHQLTAVAWKLFRAKATSAAGCPPT